MKGIMFQITEKERDQIIKELAEAPAKYTFNAINFLANLKPINEPEKAA